MLAMLQVLGKTGASKKVMNVPLSNDTIRHRVCDMSQNVKAQVLGEIKRSKTFILQLDESMDVSNHA